ncbi:MAG TPA: NADP-dependent oxidoreductase [Herpetosiphonaceae bacterium]
MQAVRFHTYGAADVLRIETVAQPRPRRDEVLIRVAASSLNPADIGGRSGAMRLIHARRLPHTPGYDVVGEIVACGPAATAFVTGERVWAMVGLGAGAQAEYVAVPQARVAAAPSRLSDLEAAAVPLAGLTALQALRRKGRLRGGERVLVTGAAGGVGSFAVQLAKLLRCKVSAVCRPAHVETVRGLGADAVGDRLDDPAIRRGAPWDLILDAAGMLPFAAAQRDLAPGGIMSSPTGRPQDMIRGAASRLQGGPRYAFVITQASGPDLALLARLADRGALRPLVDRVFDLAEIQAAHRYFEQGGKAGKIVIRVAAPRAD